MVKMPKVKASAKAHTSAIPNQEVDTHSSHKESASSDHESDSEIWFHPSRKQATNPIRQQMFMPYIKGPKMDWTVNDSLYHHFLKWKLKCENILECELAALPEPQQCKKLIAWSGDFGMDQYVSWGLTKRWIRVRDNLVLVWGVLQASVQWGVCQIWLANKLLPGVQKCGWVVQLCTSSDQSGKIPTWDSKNLA